MSLVASHDGTRWADNGRTSWMGWEHNVWKQLFEDLALRGNMSLVSAPLALPEMRLGNAIIVGSGKLLCASLGVKKMGRIRLGEDSTVAAWTVAGRGDVTGCSLRFVS